MHEHGNMNIEQNKGSYDAFVKLTTWGTILCAAIAVVVVMVIT
ncbi:MAG: aa3-type cytochrome c oxidase subunit IV [Sneathiella sp.]|nr:aa3-type cytochrome c oxidase subunit IV [Sneathiella sp.]